MVVGKAFGKSETPKSKQTKKQVYLKEKIAVSIMGFLLFFKLGEGPEAPQVASSDDDRSMSSDESELESDEEEREKRLYVVAVFVGCGVRLNHAFVF